MDKKIKSNIPWQNLASDYERARVKEDSLDNLVEWPAQKNVLGEIRGKSFLDLGCGNGAKLAEIMDKGAVNSFGIDVRGDFTNTEHSDLEFAVGDLSELENIPALKGRSFDRIMFLQSFGYAQDSIKTLKVARSLLTDDGFILLSRTQPVSYALKRAEINGTSLGEEYFSTQDFSYASNWNDNITLTKRPYTISDLLNIFSAAGLWVEVAIEPQLSESDRLKFPHKQSWMERYLGILIFKLRPLPKSGK
ncbi:class I SAM-dependent methyltransferase [bacterium]|nr:class I SAM-dependent methyltransferase [bacterium]